ncbi:MAG: ABC transporter ATP-binding protein [Desulfobacula sp.]|uniref:ABC transporter ATP-binding protein n=1 Tax=Desulfobacula sp. TaxID=2593537 RepID=UPI0025BE8121|nr:ABC transporter ATP-binding protein [Desulfobacula sp.]MCD4722779.1 ABC transporter ATP-binding protein [Desulfobacula sp.]
MESIIKISQLTKYYGKSRGIEDLSLSITKGEIFGFLGPNGAGKSTTIRLMLNLLRPSSGEVKIFNKNVQKHYTKIFKNIGNVPGELKLYEELTGNYFLNYMNKFSHQEPKWQNELIDAFHLSDADLNKKIKQYSHGMKQKLGIIQALQDDPELIIMDEPSEGLDPMNKNILYDYLEKFKKAGKTIFFSSHYLAEVEKICDRVGLVKNGKLITEESISSLKEKMVRRLEVIFAQPVSGEDFDLQNTDILEQDSHRLVLNVRGNINLLLKQITKYEVKNLVFPEPSLEETFMTFYKKE